MTTTLEKLSPRQKKGWVDELGVLNRESLIWTLFLVIAYFMVQVVLPDLILSHIQDANEQMKADRRGGFNSFWDSATPVVKSVMKVSPVSSSWVLSLVRGWDRGTAHVDWCENNYSKSAYIAEFYNCFSNVLFFLCPPIGIYYYLPYSRRVGAGINVVFVLLMLVGAGSGYFHATLTMSGQLFDEWAILWVILTTLGLFLPKWRFLNTPWIRGDRHRLQLVFFGLAVVGTALSVLYPVVNAFMLLSTTVPCVIVVWGELKNEKPGPIKRIGLAAVTWVIIAIVAWVNDRLFCEFWNGFWFPYPQLHALWHITIFVASYLSIVLMSFFFTRQEAPELHPRICYWPARDIEVGIPYLEIDEEVV